ncbi:hypothetical protein Ancab_012225, partial [Ancistrocladus abbreviatus]
MVALCNLTGGCHGEEEGEGVGGGVGEGIRERGCGALVNLLLPCNLIDSHGGRGGVSLATCKGRLLGCQ